MLEKKFMKYYILLLLHKDVKNTICRERKEMATFRVNKTSDYTVISNYHLREKEMSLKAKGLLTLMLSLPENWDYSISGLASICAENETAIKTGLKELKKFGYLRISKIFPSKERGNKKNRIYL